MYTTAGGSTTTSPAKSSLFALCFHFSITDRDTSIRGMQSNDTFHPILDRHSSHDVSSTARQKNQASPDRDIFTDMLGGVYDREMRLNMWNPESAKVVMESIGRWLDKCRTMGMHASHDVVWDLYVDEYVAHFLISS
jgi:hypothetical protein